MQQFRKGLLGFVALSVTIIMMITVFTVKDSNAEQKTLIFACEAEPSQLDPHISNTWNTFRIITHMFESFVAQDLTKEDVDRPPIVPALATNWDISEDGKTYTFYLRKGVKFHDGTPWNAEAAKFNLDRMTNPGFEYYSTISAGKMGWMWGDLASYEVVDEYTFKINLKQPNSEFIYRLTMGGSGSPTMISPDSVKKWGNDEVTNHPVGTGPFTFVERVYGEKVVLEKNSDYWNSDRIPKVDRWIIRGINEVATRELALQAGEVDIIATPSPDSVDYLISKGFIIAKGPVPTIYNLWVNFHEPYFKDVRVRRAIAMAIDREGMAKYLKREFARPAYGILNYAGPGYDPDFRDYAYNPEKAKQLLAEAGYPDGFETRLDWTLGGGGDVNTELDAQWIQRDLAQIGIKATIELFDNNTYWDMMANGMRPGTGFMSVSWGECAFFWLDIVIAKAAIPPNGFNSGYYENEQIDELLSQARQAMTTEEQEKYLREIQRIVAEDAAFIPYFSSIQIYMMNPKLKGFVLAPQHWHDFTMVTKE